MIISNRKPCFILLLLFVAGTVLCSYLAVPSQIIEDEEDQSWLKAYNIVWSEPSNRAIHSMPFAGDFRQEHELVSNSISRWLMPSFVSAIPITGSRTNRSREVPRYPTFYDTMEFNQRPDMDHGSSGMIQLQEMLLQVVDDRILLFPAWPKEWDVDFRLHAPFNTLVEASVRKGEVISLRVTPVSRSEYVELLNGFEPGK